MDEQKLKKLILEVGLGNHDGVVGYTLSEVCPEGCSGGCSSSCSNGCPSTGCSSRCESAGNNIMEGRLM